jgi:hypothetical protein
MISFNEFRIDHSLFSKPPELTTLLFSVIAHLFLENQDIIPLYPEPKVIIINTKIVRLSIHIFYRTHPISSFTLKPLCVLREPAKKERSNKEKELYSHTLRKLYQHARQQNILNQKSLFSSPSIFKGGPG